jgi:signal transduction histidine kinase
MIAPATRRGHSRWAWTVWGATIAIALARPVIAFAAGTTESIWEFVFAIAAIAASATVGAMITSRQPGNRVGLLFSTLGAAAAISTTAGDYASLGVQRGLPLTDIAAWASQLAFAVMIFPFAFLFLIYPTGRIPTPRWRWVLRVMLVAFGINVTLFALTPGVIASGFVDAHDRIVNPIALPMAWREIVQGITELAGIVVFVGALLSVVSLVLRFRRAGGEERQQIRWLAYLAAFLAVWLVTMLSLELSGLVPQDASSFVGNLGFFVLIIGLFFGVPVTCAIAILRYRLYDLDVVIKKAVVAFLLVSLVTVVAVVVAIAIPALVLGSEADRASTLAVAAGVALGLALSPVRRIARRWADRIVYGKRATPYEVLTEFGGRAAQAYSTDDVLPRLAQVLAAGTGAMSARVLLRVGAEHRESARWPAAGHRGDGQEHVEPVIHQGEELGALAVTMPASDPMDPSKEKLVRDLASQAGLLLRNVRLIEELRASRQRLVAAQDDERRRLERNIHDGAQQQLVALNVRLGLARQLATRDPAAIEQTLERLQVDVTAALEELRDLARGIYPPLLADQGLAAALAAQVRKAAIPVEVDADGIGRYEPDVEATVYFCTLEALNNVAKYAEASRATVRLEHGDDGLTFVVTDDGRGFDPTATSYGTGLQGIADRLDAIGGRLEVRSQPGEGTTVVGTIQLRGREA